MAKNTSKLLSGETPASPTGYIVKQIILYTNLEENNKVDIRGMVSRITVTESIYTGSVQTDLVILDASNLIEELKLNGQERIHIKIGRKEGDNKNREQLEFDTYIADIKNYSRNLPGAASYEFKCLSEHMLVNNTKTISRAFENTTGNLIKKICSSDLGIKKTDNINTDSNNIKGIYPRLRPYAAIKWLVQNSFDASSSPYYFYETVRDGVKFKSYGELIEADPHNPVDDPYIHDAFFEETVGSEQYYKEAKRKIRKLSSDLNMSKYISAGEGAFASQTHKIDIYNKNYKTTKWQYKSLKKLNQHKPFIERDFKQFGGRPLNNCDTGKNYFISLNSGNKDNYSSTLKDNINKSYGYLGNESILSHDIELAGDFSLQPGAVMHVKFLKTNLQGAAIQIDRVLTGKYLVTSITHEFGDEYIMDVRIKTDSFGADLNDIIPIIEEVPTGA